MNTLAVDLVLDVGANVGQYACELRASGYRGRIVSFEPLPDAFQELQGRARGMWEVHNVAIGDTSTTLPLYRSANSWSSSLRTIERRHLEAAPDAKVVGSFSVSVVPLDSFGFEGAIHLKADTQGYEREVLRGATKTLPKTVSLEIELSMEPLYRGQATFAELIEEALDLGFSLFGLWPAFLDPRTGAVLQLDALFARTAAIAGHAKT
jgi:FkbM family methyltransferase